MFSLTSSNVTRAQLRNSSVRLSRRASHSVKIIGAAAIALLAAGNNLALRQRTRCGQHRSSTPAPSS